MNPLELFAPIRTFVFDIDGVLTDGSLLVTEEGQMLRNMSIKDGYAMQLAIKKGYRVWIISGEASEAIKNSLNRLDLIDVHTSIESKKDTLHELVATSGIPYASVLYMGDDIPDLSAMQICGLPCCPNDAVPEIKQIVKYISPYNGGKGCVRDVIEKVLKLNRDWQLPV
ncbi:MAG TPA: HAD hydrolase family protein [Flavipsychrobacter sp.]|nr:HAD hydrolase family protein [Flavipsychrobacter sp.]